jgi:nitrogen regulatory protein P-II 1
MKLVVAIIQPDKLEDVRAALVAADISRVTINRVTGHGRQEDTSIYRGTELAPDLFPKVRLEIACNDAFVEPCIEAILSTARHGEGAVGDGKIFVLPLEECIRIRTGERGSDAI